MLAGLGHRLRHLLRAAGLAKSTYYHLLSHPAAVTRPDIEPMVAEIFARTPNGCGHRQIRMCLVHEFGVRVSHKSVLKVMKSSRPGEHEVSIMDGDRLVNVAAASLGVTAAIALAKLTNL